MNLQDNRGSGSVRTFSESALDWQLFRISAANLKLPPPHVKGLIRRGHWEVVCSCVLWMSGVILPQIKLWPSRIEIGDQKEKSRIWQTGTLECRHVLLALRLYVLVLLHTIITKQNKMTPGCFPIEEHPGPKPSVSSGESSLLRHQPELLHAGSPGDAALTMSESPRPWTATPWEEEGR